MTNTAAGDACIYTVAAKEIHFGRQSNASSLRIGDSKIGFFATAPVVQVTGYTPSNVTTDRAFNADSTTIDEIADVLGTLITDLKSYGLIG